jgi:multiple sugar transport system permease protein
MGSAVAASPGAPAEVPTERPARGVSSSRAPRIALAIFLVLGALAILFPFVWMVLTSLKPESEVITYPPRLLPQHFTFQAYKDVWTEIQFGRLFLNSVIFATGVTLVSLTLDSLTASSSG